MIKNTCCLELIFILLNIVQQQKLMKKVILTEILNLKKKDKRHQKKNLTVNFIRINTSRRNFDVDYEAGRIQTFISQFKDNKIKERDNKIKELEDEIKKLKLQSTNLSVENNFNDKK